MPEGNFRKICITLRGDQVNDLKARSRNLSKIIRDAIDYYLTLDIGSSDIAIYEMRRDIKKILAALSAGKGPGKVPQETTPVESSKEGLGPLGRIIRDEKDEAVVRLMMQRKHENTRRLVEELGYSRTEGIRDKLNSLNRRSQEVFGRPLFRYFRSKDGFDYSWWMMVDLEELEEGAEIGAKVKGKKKTSRKA